MSRQRKQGACDKPEKEAREWETIEMGQGKLNMLHKTKQKEKNQLLFVFESHTFP